MWGRNGKIVYRLKDEGAGIASYRGTIDGEYALFGRPNIVKSYWECVLDPKHVKKGGKHTVEMTVRLLFPIRPTRLACLVSFIIIRLLHIPKGRC